MAKKTNRMPRSLPILEREDFCKGRLTNGSRHCTVGWMITAQLPRTLAVERVWHQAATEVGIKNSTLEEVVERNDDPTTTLAKLAKAWNRMVELLGYTEVVDAQMKMINAKGLYETLAEISRKKAGGDFCWCRSCGKRKKVDHAKAMRSGWPRCCGVQMTIDPPQEA